MRLDARLYAFRTDNHDLITAVDGGPLRRWTWPSLCWATVFSWRRRWSYHLRKATLSAPTSTPAIAFYKEADIRRMQFIRSDIGYAKMIPLEAAGRSGPAHGLAAHRGRGPGGALFALVLSG